MYTLTTRELVIERDGGLCILCYHAGAEVHHVVPRSLWGKNKARDSAKNLCVLCKDCHTDTRQGHDEIVRLLGLLHDRYGYDYWEPIYRPWAAEMYEARHVAYRGS